MVTFSLTVTHLTKAYNINLDYYTISANGETNRSKQTLKPIFDKIEVQQIRKMIQKLCNVFVRLKEETNFQHFATVILRKV